MELHAVGLCLTVLERHDLTVFIPCCYFQALRKIRFLGNQRMIPAAGNHFRQSGENGACGIQYHLACLAVHQMRCPDDCAAECLTNGLMSQTDTQHGNLAVEVTNRLHGDAGVLRIAGTRGKDQRLRVHLLDLFYCNFVVAYHLDVMIQFADILIEIVSE